MPLLSCIMVPVYSIMAEPFLRQRLCVTLTPFQAAFLRGEECIAGCEAAVLTAQQWVSVNADKWSVQKDAAAICAALDCRGQKESVLLKSLQATFALPAMTKARKKA